MADVRAPAPTGPIDPVALARLGGLPIQARVIVEGALAGLHRARVHGSSVEFAEHKLYTPGDELRHVDWKAYARRGRYYVKQFDQEAQLTTYLVLDASASMAFDGGGAAKLDYATWLLAALAYLICAQQDAVGLITFGEARSAQAVPARASAGHLRAILDELERVRAGGGRGRQGAGVALARVAELAGRRRALIIVATDLFDPDDAVVPALRHLRGRGHDVVCLHVLAPHERTFPYDGLTRFVGLESEQALMANPAAIRATYLARLDAFLARCAEELRTAGVDYLATTTDVAPAEVVRELLVARAGRGRR
ncbi:MAG: DUF58 domain-containing protein [Kofleriaceae bacterium]